MSYSAKHNFIEQQGFRNPGGADGGIRYAALMFQPRLLGTLVLAGLVFQFWPLFVTLSLILWWNVLFPAWNPFDAVYNRFIAGPNALPRLTPAPAPRRFAQGMAATFMLGIGLGLLMEWALLSWILEILLVAALGALIFGRFCVGSYLYHIITGEVGLANRTLPWMRNR